MAKLIKNRQITDDNWQVMDLAEDDTPEGAAVPEGPVLVPLTVWLAQRDALAARDDVGVWLAGDEEPGELADDIGRLPLIAVNFPKFADGRGYSIAVLLRSRYGYSGELRAIGDVLRDQFNYLSRCGFDALQPREGRYSDAELEAAWANFDDFKEPYQASVKPQNPLFRRAQRAA